MFFLFSRLRTRVPLLSEAWFWGLFCIALLSFKNILILYWVLVAQTKKGSACKSRKPRFDPWAGKICWRRKWTPTPVFLPRESHGQRRLVSYSPWGCKESDTTKRLINTQTHTHTHIIDELFCACFRRTAKWFSHTYSTTYSFSNSCPT